MDVRCPQCQTLYELDDGQVGERAVTLKCSQCQHVFRLGGRAPVSEENQRRWMVRRKAEGDILYLNTFDTLHDWIMKREVRDEDEISRTGGKWVPLGDVGEFQPMFQVVESIAQLGSEKIERNDTSSILTMRTDTPASTDAVEPRRERIRTSLQYGGAAPAGDEQMRTEDITKKVRPTDVMPDEVAAELEQHFASEASDAADSDAELDADDEELRPTSRQEPLRATLATADISRERRDEVAPQSSSGVGTFLLIGVLAAAAFGAYAWLFQQEDFLKPGEPDVVVIGATTSAEPTKSRPTPDIDASLNAAIDGALDAARLENDAIWTMWHETASKPFYAALDIAYAEADTASVGVEVDQQLREARQSLERGRAKQASKQYRTILAKHPDNAAAVAGLGWALLEVGSSQQAAEQFRKAIAIDPGEGDAYIGLGTAHRQLGQLKEAYDAYDRYLGRFPRGAKASIASYQMKQLKKQLGM